MAEKKEASKAEVVEKKAEPIAEPGTDADAELVAEPPKPSWQCCKIYTGGCPQGPLPPTPHIPPPI